MGIKTRLSLSRAQRLFPDIGILSLHPTRQGVIDTTFILTATSCRYILKRYERAGQKQIGDEAGLLKRLQACGLHVPRLLNTSEEWYLFTYLEGETPHPIDLHKLRALGAFLGKMHRCTYKRESSFTPFDKGSFKEDIRKLRLLNPLLAKQFEELLNFDDRHDGTIHGDLFPDNTKFDGKRLGIFDFIESGNGSFHFDTGITAMSWIGDEKISKMKLQMFLKAYNQNSPRKLELGELLTQMQYAALAYGLQRRLNDEHELDYSQMLKKHARIKLFKKDILKRALPLK